jgi:hypothetical protein
MSQESTPPTARRYRFPLLGLVALLLLGAGILAVYAGGPGTVEQILVTRKAGISFPLPALGTPDYYLVLDLETGLTTLETKKNTPIGNGLVWYLERPVDLTAFRGLELREEDPLQDDILDRCRVTGRVLQAQAFGFELQGPPSLVTLAGFAATILGILLLLWVVGRFIRDQVI